MAWAGCGAGKPIALSLTETMLRPKHLAENQSIQDPDKTEKQLQGGGEDGSFPPCVPRPLPHAGRAQHREAATSQGSTHPTSQAFRAQPEGLGLPARSTEGQPRTSKGVAGAPSSPTALGTGRRNLTLRSVCPSGGSDRNWTCARHSRALPTGKGPGAPRSLGGAWWNWGTLCRPATVLRGGGGWGRSEVQTQLPAALGERRRERAEARGVELGERHGEPEQGGVVHAFPVALQMRADLAITETTCFNNSRCGKPKTKPPPPWFTFSHTLPFTNSS